MPHKLIARRCICCNSENLAKAPAVLDWGEGNGINTPFLGQSSTLHIHDISAVPCVLGAEPANPAYFGHRHYDLVACSQMLEHVPYPLELIETMLPSLGAETLLYLEVPHEALMREFPHSRELAARKHHWHERINFFSSDALIRCRQRIQAVGKASAAKPWRFSAEISINRPTNR